MKDIIEVGKIINVHGIKGQLKINPYTEIPEDFYNFDYLIIDGKEFDINNLRVYKGKVFADLDSIDDRSKAEALKNKSVYIPREFSDDTEEDEYLLIDLIGLTVKDSVSGKEVGKLSDILQTSGPVDNFVIKTEDKTIYVPALKEYFSIDLDNKLINSQIPEEYFNL